MKSKDLIILEALLDIATERICRLYRISPENARQRLEQHFCQNPALLKKMSCASSVREAVRLREYKTLLKTVKSEIYYSLRQYYDDKGNIGNIREKLVNLTKQEASWDEVLLLCRELLEQHVSTRERSLLYEVFYQALFRMIDTPRTILDIGCGVHPLSYPFQSPQRMPEIYFAIDKDPEAIAILTAFSAFLKPGLLVPVYSDLTKMHDTRAWRQLIEPYGCIDIVFLLKVIPVVFRNNRQAWNILADLPARQMLISASSEAMTRKKNIMRRERRILQQFIEMSGKTIVKCFNVGNEFGYLLESRGASGA